MHDFHKRVELLRRDVILRVATLDTPGKRRAYSVMAAKLYRLEEGFVAGFVADVVGVVEPSEAESKRNSEKPTSDLPTAEPVATRSTPDDLEAVED